MRSKSLRTVIAVMLIVSMIVTNLLFVYSADDYIRDIERLGDITHYNGIIFDYFESAQADIEGALAVGGQSKIGTNGQYDIGASAHHVVMGPYPNPNHYPTLLLGDKTTIGKASGASYINIYGGPVVMNKSYEQTYFNSANRFYAVKGTEFAEDDIVDRFFTDAKAEAITTVNALNDAFLSGSVPSLPVEQFTGYWSNTGFPLNNVQGVSELAKYEPDNFVIPDATGDKDLIVINITSSSAVNINEVKISKALMEYQTVVFNFPDAVNVTFNGGAMLVGGSIVDTSANVAGKPEENKLLEQYSSTIVWNFPQAKSINMSWYGIVGSVLAPHAYLEANGGSINGLLIADSFKTVGGMELHSFKMRKPVFGGKEKEEPEPEPEVLGRLRVMKVDADNNNLALAGAEFKLEYKDDSGWTPVVRDGYSTVDGVYTSPASGMLSASNMPLGWYKLTEITPSLGYDVDPKFNQGYEFELTEAHAENELLILIENRAQTHDIKFVKVEAVTGTVLPGAEFTLYHVGANGDMEAVETRIVSGIGGEAALTGLKWGTYYLAETSAPDGYAHNHRVHEIVVYQSGAIEVDGAPYDEADPPVIENEPLVVDPADDPMYELEVIKIDSETHLWIDGAAFELYKRDEDFEPLFIIVEPDAVSDEEHAEEPDEPEVWAAEEEEGSASENEDTAESEDENPQSDVDEDETDNDGMTNQDRSTPEENGIEADGENELTLGLASRRVRQMVGSGLPDAEPELDGDEEAAASPETGGDYSAVHGPVITPASGDEWELVFGGAQAAWEIGTHGRMYAKDLVAGEYKLVEVNPPAGYTTGRDIFFTLPDDANESNVIIIEMKNDPVPPAQTGSIEIHKIEDDGDMLYGAQFALYKELEDGRWLKLEAVPEYIGNTATFSKLEPGTYWVVETDAPDGYELLEHAIGPFIIETSQGQWNAPGYSFDSVKTADSDILDPYDKLVYVVNEPEYEAPPVDVCFRKVDYESRAGLADAEFELAKYNMHARAWQTYKTGIVSGPDGTFVLAELYPGLYKLIETKAPNNYVAGMSSGYTFTVGADDTQDLWQDTIEIENYPVTTDVTANLWIEKIGLDGQGVGEAIFNLYRRYERPITLPGGTDPGDEDEGEGYILYRGWLKSDDAGSVEIAGLSPGNYKLVEIEAPSGYLYDEENPITWHFDVDDSGNITSGAPAEGSPISYDDNTLTATIENNFVNQFTMSIVKLSEEERQPLQGAIFDLYRQYQQPIAVSGSGDEETVDDNVYWDIYRRIISDNNGIVDVEPITTGWYLLEEVEAPVVVDSFGEETEYSLAKTTKYTFEILKDETGLYAKYADQALPSGTELNFSIYNSPAGELLPTGTITVRKVDAADTMNLLEGAEFRFYYEMPIAAFSTGSDTVIVKEYYEKMNYITPVWTPVIENARVFATGEDGAFTLKHITAGTYYAEEVTAPEGYRRIDPIEVVVSFENGQMQITSDNPNIVSIVDVTGGGDPHLAITISNEEEDSSRSRRRWPSAETPRTTEPGEPEEPNEPDEKDPVTPEDEDDPGTGSGGGSAETDRDPWEPSDELDDTPKTGALDLGLPLILFNLFSCGYIMFYLRDCFREKKSRYRPKQE